MKYFRLLPGGSSVVGMKDDGTPHTVKPGEVVKSDKDLDKLFTHRYEQVYPNAGMRSQEEIDAADSVVETDSADEVEDVEMARLEKQYGSNVTEDFESAVDASLYVFKKGRYHYIVDPEEPEDSLNEKGLLADAVDDFINKELD